MKCLITGAVTCAEALVDFLGKLNFEVYYLKNENEPLPSGALDAEMIFCNGLFLHHDIKKFSNLKYIQLTSAGFDRVPVEYIEEKGIKIYNARGVYSIPMAEYAFCGVLELYKKSRFFLENQKAHKWEKNRQLLELYAKNVLIVGCGNVGTECAKRFRAFGCEVSGVDLYPFENSEYTQIVSFDKLDEKLKSSDIVVLTLPLTNETKNLFTKERFKLMKEQSVLVNISRGAVVNEQDLIEALRDKLLGAVLDVFESEPLDENSRLWDMENAIITPHNSFVGEGNEQRLWSVIKNNLENYV